MAVYVGRFSPLHLGHESIIKTMIQDVGFENVLILIGSATEFGTDRNPYSYTQRRDFIRTVFPRIRILPLGDVSDDDVWIQQLNDLVESVFGSKNVVYYIGSIDDAKFYSGDRTIKVVDRKTLPISGTLVRECLRTKTNIDPYVNSLICGKLTLKFDFPSKI